MPYIYIYIHTHIYMPNLIKLCIFKYVQFITCQLYLSKPVKTETPFKVHGLEWRVCFPLIAPDSMCWNYRQEKLPAWPRQAPGLQLSSQGGPGSSPKSRFRGCRAAVCLYALHEGPAPVHTAPLLTPGLPGVLALIIISLLFILLSIFYDQQHKQNHLTQINSPDFFFSKASICKIPGKGVCV